MYRKLLPLFLYPALVILFLTGCSEKEKPLPSPREEESVSEVFVKYFKSRFIKDNPFYQVPSSTFIYFDTLKDFYSKRDFTPIFIKHEKDVAYVDSVLNVFAHADEHGLDKNLYHYDLIREEIGKSLAGKSDEEIYVHLSNAELLTCDALIRYAYHMRYGVVDPRLLFPDYSLPLRDAEGRDLFKPLYQKELFKYLGSIEPQDDQYKKLQSALKYYTSLEQYSWDSIVSPSQKDLITERLKVLGFYDTTNTSDSIYVKSVMYFQKATGLINDGSIGKPTLAKLNIKPEVYVEKIKLSMERFRWSSYRDSSRYVMVNIPDFRLHLMDGGKERAEIKVCTGKKRPANFDERMKRFLESHKWWQKPDDWQTPQAFGIITNIVLNPTWTVPPSIAREEIYRETMKDPEYLYKKNFKVFKDGKEISIDEVNFEDYSLNKIPFTFVQNPGDGNALGKIKFLFKNRFGIYLHDTPTRAPFNASVRAVSHGCVRVEKPYQLATFLLEGDTTWNIDYIKLETGVHIDDTTLAREYKNKRSYLRRNIADRKTTYVKLQRRVPVVVDYFTAWVDDNGKMNIRDDVYNKDKRLKEYLSSLN